MYSGNSEQFVRAFNALEKTLLELRANTPRQCISDIALADLDLSRFEVVNGEKLPRAVITLRSVGCEWTKNSGGCSMCGHWAGASVEQIPDPEILYGQFLSVFKRVNFKDYPVLCIYNGGSVTNPNEVPEEVFWRIMKTVSENDDIKTVSLESRAEYIDFDKLKKLRDILGKRKIRIAMGLESADSGVRRLLVHKGSSLEKFKKTCEMINELASLRLYGLIKPPWLTENEAILDAVATIRLGESLGAEDIHFEPVTIQNHTLVKMLWENGMYKLPSLWSVIEILKRVAPGKVYVSPFAHVPKPIAVPESCIKCDDLVKKTILQDYNKTHDVGVFDDLDCDCKKEWLKELEIIDPRSLADRVLADVELLSKQNL